MSGATAAFPLEYGKILVHKSIPVPFKIIIAESVQSVQGQALVFCSVCGSECGSWLCIPPGCPRPSLCPLGLPGYSWGCRRRQGLCFLYRSNCSVYLNCISSWLHLSDLSATTLLWKMAGRLGFFSMFFSDVWFPGWLHPLKYSQVLKTLCPCILCFQAVSSESISFNKSDPDCKVLCY